jgi:actin-related protein
VDLSALYIRRPHERGYVVHWDIEEEIFERMCHKDVLGVKPADTSLFVTEPLLSPTELKDNLDEFCFETMGFARLCTATPPLLAFNDHKHWDPDSVLSRTGCGVVVDSGFSFTHVAPLFEGRVLHKACRRIDVGGKVLTNLLKEQLSYRQWNMMDENILMNTIKERLSFVSLDFDSDLDTCRRRGAANTVRRRYALPTGIDDEDKHGYVVESESASPSKRPKADGDGEKQQNKSNRLDSECMLDMNNERFCVPEVLFCPSMIGMNQSGIQGAVREMPCPIALSSPPHTFFSFSVCHSPLVVCLGRAALVCPALQTNEFSPLMVAIHVRRRERERERERRREREGGREGERERQRGIEGQRERGRERRREREKKREGGRERERESERESE